MSFTSDKQLFEHLQEKAMKSGGFDWEAFRYISGHIKFHELIQNHLLTEDQCMRISHHSGHALIFLAQNQLFDLIKLNIIRMDQIMAFSCRDSLAFREEANIVKYRAMIIRARENKSARGVDSSESSALAFAAPGPKRSTIKIATPELATSSY